MRRKWLADGNVTHGPDLNRIADTDFSRAHHRCEDTLAVFCHQFTQTLADGIHFRARITWCIEREDRFPDFDFRSKKSDEVNALGFNIRPDRARGDRL